MERRLKQGLLNNKDILTEPSLEQQSSHASIHTEYYFELETLTTTSKLRRISTEGSELPRGGAENVVLSAANQSQAHAFPATNMLNCSSK